MGSKTVLVTDYVWPSVEPEIKVLAKYGVDLLVAPDGNENTLVEMVKEVDGILTCFAKVTKKVVEAAKNCKVIGRYGVGVDNIDISAATRRGVVVMNTPDANTISAAEHTMALILAISRNISYGHEAISKGEWNRHKLIGSELRNKTLGIVGLGKIGREVLQRSQAFNMKILGYDPYVNQDLFNPKEVEVVLLDELGDFSRAILVALVSLHGKNPKPSSKDIEKFIEERIYQGKRNK